MGPILAYQIKTALQQAGILVDDQISKILVVGGFAVGIQVNGPLAEQDLVKALADSLAHEGKLFAGSRGNKSSPGADPAKGVNILVGVKPPPDLSLLLQK